MTQTPIDSEQASSLPAHGCVIEFFGLPGTGKTTTARALYQRMLDDGQTVVFAPDLTGDAFTKWKRNAIRLRLILRALPRTWHRVPLLLDTFRVPQRTMTDKLKAVYNSWTVLSVLATAHDRQNYLIFDQGIAQATWSILLNSSRDEADFLLSEYDDDTHWHIVMLSSPIDELKTRLRTRPQKHSRLQKADDSAAERLWTRAQTMASRIAAALETQGNTTLQELSSEDLSPHELAEAVRACLSATGDPQPSVSRDGVSR